MSLSAEKITNALACPLFHYRRALLLLFTVITLLLAFSATHLRVDALFLHDRYQHPIRPTERLLILGESLHIGML